MKQWQSPPKAPPLKTVKVTKNHRWPRHLALNVLVTSRAEIAEEREFKHCKIVQLGNYPLTIDLTDAS